MALSLDGHPRQARGVTPGGFASAPRQPAHGTGRQRGRLATMIFSGADNAAEQGAVHDD